MKNLNFDGSFERFSSMLAILVFILITLTPGGISIFLLKNKAKLET